MLVAVPLTSVPGSSLFTKLCDKNTSSCNSGQWCMQGFFSSESLKIDILSEWRDEKFLQVK